MYGYDISEPAANTKEAVQWTYFAYLGAIKEQNGAAMSLGRVSSFFDIYIERDIANGSLTEEAAQEILDDFVMKLRIARHLRTPEYNELFGGDPMWITEALGGVGQDGRTLVTKTTFNVPRRTADGFDFNRAALLLAVMEKRAGMKLSAFDTYINVIGGLRLDEPAADLPVALAVASSYRDQPIASDLAAIGEIGLTGEIRAVSNISQRLAEIRRLGFSKCIIPKKSGIKLEIPEGLTVYQVKNLREAIEISM